MRKNPFLHSDYKDSQYFNMVTPIVKKRSFLLYFLIIINLLLIICVFSVIWLFLATKPSHTVLGQRLQIWTSQLINSSLHTNNQVIEPIIIIDSKKATLTCDPLKTEQINKGSKHPTETVALEILPTINLKEKMIGNDQITEHKKEPKNITVDIRPSSALDIPATPENKPKSQMELILETMQQQN